MLIHIYTDLHEEVDLMVREVEKSSGMADLVILNGDFWDTHKKLYHFSALDMTRALIKHIIPNPKVRVHFGNHDVHYRWPDNKYIRASGYKEKKQIMIDNYLKEDDWRHFNWYTKIGDWLISHAGVNQNILDFGGNFPPDSFVERLERSLIFNENSPLYGVGWARSEGFGYKKGGIIWQDWEREFEPIPGINQIVGHSVDEENPIREKSTINSINYCFDGGDRKFRCVLNTDWLIPIFEEIV